MVGLSRNSGAESTRIQKASDREIAGILYETKEKPILFFAFFAMAISRLLGLDYGFNDELQGTPQRFRSPHCKTKFAAIAKNAIQESNVVSPN